MAQAKTRKRKKATRSKKRKASAKAPPLGVCAVTGLPVGAAARDAWAAQVEQALAGGRPCAFALLDVDDFGRHVRDLGLARSDLLLAEVATRLAEPLGEGCWLGRLAGDQFGVVLPGVELEVALGTIELARRAASSAPYKLGRGVRRRQVAATLSAGLAALHRHGQSFRELLDEARLALWRAKALGGDRIGLPDKERMTLKTSYYPQGQLDRLKRLAHAEGVKEAVLLREALGDVLLKYKDRRPDE